MTRTPTVTVVIPTFNRCHWLVECLESILAQTMTATQIVVVNDRSTDRTQELLKPFLPAIHYVETAQQVGRAGALNTGLELAVGDYIWTFDDDDIALPNALERFVEPLEAHPEHGFSFSSFYYTATRPEDGRIGEILGESRIPDLRSRGPLIPILEANYLCGAAMFARRACYEQAGGFDASLLRSQDYELGIRFVRRFTGIQVPGGPTFHYRQHEAERGTARDRFGPGLKLRKWLEYDQITFRRLYRELPLSDYLPPGTRLDDHLRQAHLQRLATMATKLLLPEVMMELRLLAGLADDAPLSDPEREIIHSMVGQAPFYQQGNLFDCSEFFNAVRRLARSSGVAQLIREELRRDLSTQWKRKRGWKRVRRAASASGKIVRLYLPV